MAILTLGATAALSSLAPGRPFDESNPFDRTALSLLTTLCAFLALAPYSARSAF